MQTVAALYHFTAFENPDAFVDPLRETFEAAGVTGMLLLANEGLNGTIAGSAEAIETALAALRALPGCAELSCRYSTTDGIPFRRLKVRVKPEIVTMGVDGIDPTQKVGAYVEPADWNELIAREDVVLIDVRNDYETSIGQFEGAIDPDTATFRDFPAWWNANRDQFAGKAVATYCTGGIRCEKATAYLMEAGAEEVYHLKGGILAYLERTPPETSTWDGACFVFDERVAVSHGLEETDHILCRACRRPVSAEGRAHPAYEHGVVCPGCVDERSEDDRKRARERQKQIRLAEARGEVHIGPK